MAAATQPFVIAPMTTEEEDQVIQTRITLDERPLRRIVKKFHNYASVLHPPIVPLITSRSGENAVEEARDAFLLELGSFDLLMKKNAMVCDAEERQVERYRRSREDIDKEHENLQNHIEELKEGLEQAQLERKRRIEYDSVAEKIYGYPSRDELESSIQALENDMAAIRSEHDTQNRFIHGQKVALDSIISELGSLRFMGKEVDVISTSHSQRATPILEGTPVLPEATTDNDGPDSSLTSVGTEEGEEVEVKSEATKLEDIVEDNDIEMGEVQEDPKEKHTRKSREEELEEGEATDASSELSEPPDD